MRKGLLFAQRSPFREKDYPKMRKGLFCHEKEVSSSQSIVYCVLNSPTHSTIVYNLHVHVHADICFKKTNNDMVY